MTQLVAIIQETLMDADLPRASSPRGRWQDIPSPSFGRAANPRPEVAAKTPAETPNKARAVPEERGTIESRRADAEVSSTKPNPSDPYRDKTLERNIDPCVKPSIENELKDKND